MNITQDKWRAFDRSWLALAEKDAEIERLKEVVKNQNNWINKYTEDYKEIDRLKLANKSITFEYLKAQGEIEDWKENERRALLLIGELADALEGTGHRMPAGPCVICDLIERARKAVK